LILAVPVVMACASADSAQDGKQGSPRHPQRSMPMRSSKRHLQLIQRWAEIRGESGSQGEEESEQKKALAEPGQHGTEGRDVSGVGLGLAPLNALAQAAAEAEGRSRAEYGQGAGDGIENFHTDRVAGGGKGPGAERSRR
jgi:hypothetical protein